MKNLKMTIIKISRIPLQIVSLIIPSLMGYMETAASNKWLTYLLLFLMQRFLFALVSINNTQNARQYKLTTFFCILNKIYWL